ncbi:unnamed protein product [Cuscuta campestris]|uniref:Uncharacterized protein n=1 Tax=Cuscuta campestris TaxID=132261 RepID=A0A484KY35_9ASTE|nr:unnamed protein product [Cuscuta campestris]
MFRTYPSLVSQFSFSFEANGYLPIDGINEASYSSRASHHRNRTLHIIIPVIVGSVAISLCFFIACWQVAKRKGEETKEKKIYEVRRRMLPPDSSAAIIVKDETEKINIEEMPLFTFEMVLNGTDQFNENKLLGRGGFGLVYKDIGFPSMFGTYPSLVSQFSFSFEANGYLPIDGYKLPIAGWEVDFQTRKESTLNDFQRSCLPSHGYALPSLGKGILPCDYIGPRLEQRWEFPGDRPTIEIILSMLTRELVDLPILEQPVFAEKWNSSQVGTGSVHPQISINQLTLSILDGR